MRIQKLAFFIIFCYSSSVFAQFPLGLGRKIDQIKESSISYERPKEFTISKISVSGIKFLDPNTLISVSGLNVNDKITIHGERISTAIRRLMEQGIIEDVSINVVKIENENVELDIHLRERPRLNKFVFKGVRKGEIESINEKV